MASLAIIAWRLSFSAHAEWQARQDRRIDWPKRERLSQIIWLVRNPRTWANTSWGTLLGVITAGVLGDRFANEEVDYYIAPG